MVPVQNELSIIPNPVAGTAEVDFGEKVIKGSLMVTIYNLQGSVVRNFTISYNPFTISRDGIQSGIYIMVIKSEDKIRYSKIVFL
jgi:hypothetical protein